MKIKGKMKKAFKYSLVLSFLLVLLLILYITTLKPSEIILERLHEKVSISLTNSKNETTQFCFKKGYLELFPNMEGEQSVFKIGVVYPQMTPFSIEMRNQRAARKKGITLVEVDREKRQLTSQSLFVTLKPASWHINLIEFALRHRTGERIDEKIPGFSKITIARYPGEPNFEHDFFLIPDEVEDGSILFSCYRERTCRIRWFLGKTSLSVLISQKNLPLWKDIKDDLDSLLISFMNDKCE